MNRQKHKLSRRILAMLLTAAMLVTMFPAAMFAAGETEPVEEPTVNSGLVQGHSKSKTATQLDENYRSQVTLSLPSAEEQLVSDVVFVLDKSTSADLEEQAIEMLKNLNTQIKETGAKVKVGVVIFNKEAHSELALTELNDANMEAIEEAIKYEISSGTNSHAGLIAGKAMLDADTSVDANRKYMVFVSDGITYMYNAEPTAIGLDNGDNNVFAGPENWVTKYGNNEAPEDWDSWLTEIGQMIQTDGTSYEATYGGPYETYISKSEAANHAMSIDKALYLTHQVYQSAKNAGYQCYAMNATTSASYPWASSFMNYLANGETVDFDQIQNDIYYLLDAGSKVDDYMGYVESDYNFDFVNDASALSMKVGETTYEAVDLGENRYGFAPDESVDAEYDYILEYYPAENGDEQFTWTTNVPVSNFAPVQLTYTVQLMNPKEEAGTYGRYDADGSEKYEGLYTNNSAILTPVDSNQQTGTPEEFAKPTVSYTVEEQVPEDAIAIRPADITIYTGGNGYDSVVNGSDGELATTNNGLPTPGFYIDMSDSMNEWLLEKVNPEDITTNDDGKQVIDLSGYLTFTYNKDTVTRTWSLERYDNKQDNTSMAYSQYIYRITPGVSADGTETPIRLQFTDDKGAFMTSDDFSVGLNELFHQYDMSIYPGDLEQKLVKAVLTIGEETYELESEVKEGKLIVRGVTDNNTATTDVIDAAPTDEVENITAQVPANTKFYINESKLEVVDADKVSLLVDSIVPDENNTLLNKAVTGFDEITSNHKYQLNYLDLVDTSNGNAWVTADEPITVYWPYPEGTSMETNFQIVHYDGLDRDDNGALTGNDFTMTRYSADSQNTNVLENTPQGIKITVNSFSPFALFWEEADDDNPPYIPPTTGDDDDDEEEPDTPALDKVNHFLYVEGYPEDYRTGEYSDNEDLWPVKPQGNITRAEVATIFYRLLKDEVREEIETDVNSFPDVNEDDWFNITVSLLANMGALSGYEDGTFRPNEPISRAELAAMAVRFYDAFEAEYEEGTFLDVDGDEWYADAIAAAEELGIIGGYPDGTVRSNNNITRAETCAIVNRVLERRPHDEHLGDVDDMRTWPDNQPGAWYYADMQEATNGHYYEWIDIDGSKFEEWTEVDKDYDWTKR